VLSSRATTQHEDESTQVRDPVPLEPSERICRYVTASMLRTNSAPWCITPARPATLSGFNIGAGMKIWTCIALPLVTKFLLSIVRFV
jgi:hypothetical protein